MLTRLKVINDDRVLSGGGLVTESLFLRMEEQVYHYGAGDTYGIRMRLVRRINRPIRDQIYSALGGVVE